MTSCTYIPMNYTHVFLFKNRPATAPTPVVCAFETRTRKLKLLRLCLCFCSRVGTPPSTYCTHAVAVLDWGQLQALQLKERHHHLYGSEGCSMTQFSTYR